MKEKREKEEEDNRQEEQLESARFEFFRNLQSTEPNPDLLPDSIPVKPKDRMFDKYAAVQNIVNYVCTMLVDHLQTNNTTQRVTEGLTDRIMRILTPMLTAVVTNVRSYDDVSLKRLKKSVQTMLDEEGLNTRGNQKFKELWKAFLELHAELFLEIKTREEALIGLNIYKVGEKLGKNWDDYKRMTPQEIEARKRADLEEARNNFEKKESKAYGFPYEKERAGYFSLDGIQYVENWKAAAMLCGLSLPQGFDNVVVLDARYPYEFEAGHIHGALNIWYAYDAIPLFFDPQNMKKYLKTVFLIHCEFSSSRAPGLWRKMKLLDEEITQKTFGALDIMLDGVDEDYLQMNYSAALARRKKNNGTLRFFPHLYVIKGGYKSFYESYRNLCFPSQYLQEKALEYTDLVKYYTKNKMTVGAKAGGFFDEYKKEKERMMEGWYANWLVDSLMAGLISKEELHSTVEEKEEEERYEDSDYVPKKNDTKKRKSTSPPKVTPNSDNPASKKTKIDDKDPKGKTREPTNLEQKKEPLGPSESLRKGKPFRNQIAPKKKLFSSMTSDNEEDEFGKGSVGSKIDKNLPKMSTTSVTVAARFYKTSTKPPLTTQQRPTTKLHK